MSDLPKPGLSRAVILLPADRFFVRTVPLVAEASAAAQAELAVETLAPFPLGQLNYGFWTASARDQALVFAAHRKRFLPEESADWNDAWAVLPAFVALLGEAPTVPTIRVWTRVGALTAAAWDGRNGLPVAVLSRETEGTTGLSPRDALVAEIRARCGLASATVQEFSGEPEWERLSGKAELTLKLTGRAGPLTTILGRAELESVDVRDKEFLARQRALARRETRLWRGFVGCAAGLVLCLLLELGFVAAGFALRNVQARVQAAAPAVERIATAQALSVRIEEITQRRLMPLEMLALINPNRPASIQFVRTSSVGQYSLEIEAQTGNAPDIGQYEAALRATPELAKVETRDLRTRDGLTSFVLSVTFKPEALHAEVVP